MFDLLLGKVYSCLLLYRFGLGLIELICYFLFRGLHNLGLAMNPRPPRPMTVAIVCATVSDGKTLTKVLPTWQANNPTEIWIVTNETAYQTNRNHIEGLLGDKVKLIACSHANKRTQLCEGFMRTTSEIVVVCDDDTVWSPVVLERLTRPFQTGARTGAVFPEVKFRPAAKGFNFWEMLSAVRLFGDAIDTRTSMLLDGGVFCASGTTAAYRGEILRDPKFIKSFSQELCLGRQLNAGDDQSLTVWLANQDWNCRIVADEGVSGFSVLTTTRTDWRQLSQLVRWSRSNWQAYLTATVTRRATWTKYPYTTLKRLTWCAGSFSFLIEALFLYTQRKSSNITSMFLVLQASRLIRYTPEFINFPGRLLYLIPIIVYLYIYQCVSVFALLTISNTAWS